MNTFSNHFKCGLMRWTIVLIATVFTHLACFAAYDCVDGIYYKIDDDGVSVTVTTPDPQWGQWSYSKLEGDVVIPEQVEIRGKTYTVRYIADEGLRGAKLTSLTLPHTLRAIGKKAIANQRIKSITFPDSLYYIDEEAFANTDLDTVVLPAGLAYVGKDAFVGTPWYNRQPDGLVCIGTVAYKYKGGVPDGAVVDIPDGITQIGGGCFDEEEIFSSEIDDHHLKGVNIPETVTSIGPKAFRFCLALESVELPKNLTHVFDEAFYNCSSVQKCTLPQSLNHIGAGAFHGMHSIKDLTIPPFINGIREGTFTGWGITELIIPGNVKEIQDHAFAGCTNLKHLVISGPIKEIGEGAFQSCISLEDVTFQTPELSVIDDWAFAFCYNLKEFCIPNSVKTIGACAFMLDSCLTDIFIPNSVKNFGWRFGDVLRGCTKLKQVIIPNSVKSIGLESFTYCTSLERVIIGESVERMDYHPFNYTPALTGIYFKGKTPPTMPDYASDNEYDTARKQEITLYVPQGSLQAYREAVYWKEFTHIEEVDYKELMVTDIDGDGHTDVQDVNIMLNSVMGLGKLSTRIASDIDTDGLIDVHDLNIVINRMLAE